MRPVPVRQLLMFLTSIAILPALVIIIWAGIEHGTTQEQDIRTRTQHDVQMLGLLQNTISTSVNQTLSTVASLPAFRTNELDSQWDILGNVLAQNPAYVNLSFTDVHGIVQSSALLNIGADLSDRKHIQDALAGKTPAAGEFILALVGEIPSLPFAVPVLNYEGVIIGALTTVYRLDEYSHALSSLDLSDNSLLLILDHSGILLYSSDPREKSGEIICAELLPSEIGGISTSVTTSHNGTRRFFAIQPQTMQGNTTPYMYILIGIPERIARRAMLLTILRNIVLMIIAGGASLLIIRRIGDRMIGHGLRQLQKTAQEIEQGNLAARTELSRGPRELFCVSRGISSMASALQERSNERDRTEKNLHIALQENKTLLREVHHRVKNNMQLILSMVYLERDSSVDMENFIRQIESRINAMSSVHELLYESDSLAQIEISIFLQHLVDLSRNFIEDMDIQVDSDEHAVILDQAVPVALITNERLINAAKYGASKDGRTRVNLVFRVETDTAMLTVRDHGPGLPADYGSKSQETLGMILLQTLAEQIGGAAEFGGDSSGAVISVQFPLQKTG